jgi:aspartyl-tRNA(Asn)/glutamyl-tRNA(Gln) amidotransferase subunit A
MADADILYLTISELGEMLRSRKVSSRELTQSYIARIKQLDSKLNAFVTITDALAMEQAERADREMERGSNRGPLHGIPFAAKDLLATGGIPTTWGSRVFEQQVFPYDATVIGRLRDAGAVLLGKLNMIELAGGTGYRFASASARGATHNPWDLGRWSGGSSSGSGAAVGAALAAFAIGSETWGSIMVPSAFCGITGLRPSYGRVSRYGAMTNSWTLDKLGPMARSAEDCGLILDVINGIDPKDPTVKTSWRFERRSEPLRIGVFSEAESPIAKLASDAIEVMKSAGHAVQTVQLPDFQFEAVTTLIQRAEAGAVFWQLTRDGRLNDLTDAGMRSALASAVGISAIEYIQANRIREEMRAVMEKFFDQVDVVAAPTLPIVATKLEDNLEAAFAPLNDRLGAIGNLVGLPAISVPVGLSRDGF